MSDADSFIREVSDEVRRDRLFRLWRRWGPFVIGGIVAVVAATGLLAWLDHREAEAARQAGGRLLAAASAERPAERLLAEADALEPGAAALARLQAAAALAAEGRAAEAAALYERVAEGSAAPQPIAEFAALRAALTRAEAGETGEARQSLEALGRADTIWRPLALEALGALRLSEGDREGARADLRAAAEDPRATAATRERVAALLETLPAEGPETPPAEDAAP